MPRAIKRGQVDNSCYWEIALSNSPGRTMTSGRVMVTFFGLVFMISSHPARFNKRRNFAFAEKHHATVNLVSRKIPPA